MLTGKVISFQNGRDNFLRGNGWQNCGRRRFPNKWISANHSDSRVPAVNGDGKIKSGDNCANTQRVPSLEQIVTRALRRKDLTREHTGHSYMNSKLYFKTFYFSATFLNMFFSIFCHFRSKPEATSLKFSKTFVSISLLNVKLTTKKSCRLVSGKNKWWSDFSGTF